VLKAEEKLVPKESRTTCAEPVMTVPEPKARRFALAVIWFEELKVMFLSVAVDPERDSSKMVPRVSTIEPAKLFHSMLLPPAEEVTETFMFPSVETISPGHKAKPCLLLRALETGSTRMLMSPVDDTILPAVEPRPKNTPQWFRVVFELELTWAEILILPVAESIVV
jgi:hypothetical protein